MFDAFLAGLGGGCLSYLLFNFNQELRLWRVAVGLKNVQEQRLSDVRARSANKRFDNEAELAELAASLKKNTNASAFDQAEDKWGGFLKR